MVRTLTTTEIQLLLKSECVGRIGCSMNDTIYVVPISYVYDGENIYAHTYEGLKLAAMRKNPAVCFEIDHFEDMNNWQSVIAWGKFEEVTQLPERMKALNLLISTILNPAIEIDNVPGNLSVKQQLENIAGIVFKINLVKYTGRCETSKSIAVYAC